MQLLEKTERAICKKETDIQARACASFRKPSSPLRAAVAPISHILIVGICFVRKLFVYVVFADKNDGDTRRDMNITNY